MYLDFDTNISLLLITDKSPVITISAEQVNTRAIKRCGIFGIPGFTRKSKEMNAAASETSLIKYLSPKIDLLKLCLAAYTATDPKSKAADSQTGIARILNRSGSMKIFNIYKNTIQIMQTAANSPLALTNLLNSDISATGISQNSVSFLDVAHLETPVILETAQLIRMRNITDARSDTNKYLFSKIREIRVPNKELTSAIRYGIITSLPNPGLVNASLSSSLNLASDIIPMAIGTNPTAA